MWSFFVFTVVLFSLTETLCAQSHLLIWCFTISLIHVTLWLWLVNSFCSGSTSTHNDWLDSFLICRSMNVCVCAGWASSSISPGIFIHMATATATLTGHRGGVKVRVSGVTAVWRCERPSSTLWAIWSRASVCSSPRTSSGLRYDRWWFETFWQEFELKICKWVTVNTEITLWW